MQLTLATYITTGVKSHEADKIDKRFEGNAADFKFCRWHSRRPLRTPDSTFPFLLLHQTMHIPSPCSRRRKLLAIAVLLFGLTSALTLHWSYDIRAHVYAIQNGKWPWMGGAVLRTHPPAYDSIIEMERTLPQHNLSLPYPEGKNGRYVKFSYQLPALGWNNVLTEMYA